MKNVVLVKDGIIHNIIVVEDDFVGMDGFEVHPYTIGSVGDAWPPSPQNVDLVQIKLDRIAVLESQITPRRIREAVLGTDGGWLAQKEAAIEAARQAL